MRSTQVKKGSTRAAHRSLFYAMGYTEEELKKPLIGICCAANEIIPGHMHLDTIAKAAKYGVLEAGGTPIEFPAIGICDGIAMGHDGMKYPLASRELVADSIEAVANGHAFDGLILIPNCDKIRSRHADGSSPSEHPDRCCQRRSDAARSLSGQRYQRIYCI